MPNMSVLSINAFKSTGNSGSNPIRAWWWWWWWWLQRGSGPLLVPMHLGLNNGALCAPYQFMGALLLCWSSRWPPNLYSQCLLTHSDIHVCRVCVCVFLLLLLLLLLLRACGGADDWGTAYKPEGRGFDSLCCHCNFSLTSIFRPQYGSGILSASNKNEYQEYFLGGKGGRYVGMAILPPLCVDCIEIWWFHPPWTLLVCNSPAERIIYLHLFF
jgi:hypothetical protein